VNRDLAKATLEGIVALDRPIGQLMEIANKLDECAEKTALKECCGTLLRLQFDLVERIASAYPGLRDVDPTVSDNK
jgi:hypothetical protein